MHLVGFIIRIYQEVWSPERQRRTENHHRLELRLSVSASKDTVFPFSVTMTVCLCGIDKKNCILYLHFFFLRATEFLSYILVAVCLKLLYGCNKTRSLKHFFFV